MLPILMIRVDFTRYKGGAMNTSGNSVQTYRWWNKYNGVVGHKGVYDIGTLESYIQYNALEQVKTLTSSNDGNAPWTTKTGSPMSIVDSVRNSNSTNRIICKSAFFRKQLKVIIICIVKLKP